MKKNQLWHFINFIRYCYVNRKTIYQECDKRKELEILMVAEKVKTVFQPILSLCDGSTVGFEILNRPQSTPIFPNTEVFYEYIGTRSDVFFIEQFLRHLSIKRYSEQTQTLNRHKDKLIFLNIQPQVLADPTFKSGKTLELLAKYNISPKQVVLELTEKEAVTDYQQFEKIIDHYRVQGFRIAVDDTGAGYNSLQTIVSLKPDFIKIDKSLIRNIVEHPEKQHLVELLLKFATQSKSTIIAEGIETLTELSFLQNIGVHLGQGYALGKPKPDLMNGQVPLSNQLLKGYSYN